MSFINKKIEIKFDVNWMQKEDSDKLNSILVNILEKMEQQLDLKNYAVCNLNIKTKEY